MAEGRSRAAWSHTASLMALLANINRDPKRRRQPFKVEDFNPHGGATEPARRRPLAQIDVKNLRQMYVDGMGIPVREVKAADIKVRKRDLG